MKPLQSSLPDLTWARPDSQHLVPAATATVTEECSGESPESPVYKRHPPRTPGASAACSSTPNGGAEHASTSAAADNAWKEVDGSAAAAHADLRKFNTTSAESTARTYNRRDSRKARCRAARDPLPAVALCASATVDAAGADTTTMPPSSADSCNRDLTLKTPVNAGEFNAPSFAQREKEQNLRLLEDASISAPAEEASSALAQTFPSQGDISGQVASSNSPSGLPSCSGYSPTVNGNTGQESEKPPSQEETKELTVSCVTLAEPALQEKVAGLDAATHSLSQTIQQATRDGSCCTPQGIATAESESGDQKDSERLGRGLHRRGFGEDAAVCEATGLSAPSWNTGVDTALQRQVQLLPLHPEDSTNHVSSQTQNLGAQQLSQLVPRTGTTGLRQLSLQLQQERPEEAQQQSKSPLLFLEQAAYPGFDVATPPSRPPSPGVAFKGPRFNAQYSRVSDALHLPASWQASNPEAAQQKNYPWFIVDGCESSGRDPAQLASATLPVVGSLTSVPCCSHSTWPMCSASGVTPAGLPSHPLQQLEQQLQKHMLPDWSPSFSLPNFYFQTDQSGAETLDCTNVYDTGRSSTPAAWPEAIQEAKGSYSPGGLWQPAPSASVKQGVQTSLQMAEPFSFEHFSVDCNNGGGCGGQQWICRMHSEQPCHSLVASSQAAACWLQQAQQETTQRHHTQHFEQYEVCDNAPTCAAHAALTTFPHTLEAEGSEAQRDWTKAAAQVGSRTERSPTARDRSSNMYRRQLLQQLALRYNQQTRQAEDSASLMAHGTEDRSEPGKKEGGLAEERAPTTTHQPCTEEQPGVRGDCNSSSSANPEEGCFTKGYDATPTCVTAPPDTNLSLVAAAEAQRSQTANDVLNRVPQPEYEGTNFTQAPKSEESMNRCTRTTNAHQFVAADEAADFCSLRQQMQWVAPPPEAAAALAAARAAAASAAAAIAAEWQQHLEQHYLEDWMQQLSPAHQWWLLHLQQTDQLSTRSTPFYMKEWQAVENWGPNIAVCAAADAESRSVPASAPLRTTQEQQQLLQNASEDKWATGFNEQQPWDFQTCALEQLMPPASSPWTAFSHVPMTPAAAVTRGNEEACWQYASETNLELEPHTTGSLRSSSRQQIPALHRCARMYRSDQSHSAPGESTQQWRCDATCPAGTNFSAATVPPNDRATPFVPQYPRQQRQLLRVAQRSAARLSLYGHAGGLQHATSGQVQRNMPNRLGRRWRRVYRGHLAEGCYKDVLLSMKTDVSCPRRSSCCVPCCVEAATSCSCNRCTIHDLRVGGARRTGGDCIPAGEFVCPPEVGHTCRSRSICRREEDFRRGALRCEGKAAELDIRAPVRRPGRRESAGEQTCLWLQQSPKRLITRSCCPPNTRCVIEGNARRRGGSQGGVPQAESTAAVELDGSVTVECGPAVNRKDAPCSRELLNCKKVLQCRQANRSGEEAGGGEGLRSKELHSRGCNNRNEASNLVARLGDKAPTDSTNHLSASSPTVSCSCGEGCVQGPAKRNARGAAASPPTSSRRSRHSERLRAARQSLPSWGNSGRCRACQAGSRTGSSTGTFCSSRQGNSDENCSRNSGAGLCGEIYRREEEVKISFDAEKGGAPRKPPAPSMREGPAEREDYFTAPRTYNRECVVSSNAGTFVKDAEQGEADEVVASPAGRGRRCQKEAMPQFEGAKGHRAGLGCTGGSPVAAVGNTVASSSSSSCSATPSFGDTPCHTTVCPKGKAALHVPSEAPLKAALPAGTLEAQPSVAGGGGSSNSDRDKVPDGRAATGNTDTRCGNATGLKARSWLAVVREAAARPKGHTSSTKSTTRLVQQLLRQEAVSQRPQLQKQVQEPAHLDQPGTAKASACSNDGGADSPPSKGRQ